MIVLAGMNLKKLIPLYQGLGIEESLTEAVLKGVVKGWAHVNNAASPSCALVMHAHAGAAFWLGAEPERKEAEAFTEQLFAYKSDREFCSWMEFGNFPESMAQHILQRVPKACRTGRQCFVHDRAAFKAAPEPAPKDDITIDLYREGDPLPEEIRMESPVFWDQETDVVRGSAAVAAWDAEGKLRGICISAAAVEGCWEIDIAADPEHRQKGIGYAMAHAYITECLNRGCTPRWNCRRDNEASYNLAIKLGFKPANGYDLLAWDRKDEACKE